MKIYDKEEPIMKIAEALMLRADIQTRISELKKRLIRSAKVQEGEKSPENPSDLLVELDHLLRELNQLIKRINKTNSTVEFEKGKSLADVLADRDNISLKRNVLLTLIEAATIQQDRYSKSEVKYFSTVDISSIQKEIDRLAKQYRKLDSKIQEKNWTNELIMK